MVKKEECIPGTKAIVNRKPSKWNQEIGAKQGLVCWKYKKEGVYPGCEKELPPDSKIEILGPPKRLNGNGVQVLFKVEGDDTLMSSYWVCFKHKIDLA